MNNAYYFGLALLVTVEAVGVYLLAKGLWLRNRSSRDRNEKKALLDTELSDTK